MQPRNANRASQVRARQGAFFLTHPLISIFSTLLPSVADKSHWLYSNSHPMNCVVIDVQCPLVLHLGEIS